MTTTAVATSLVHSPEVAYRAHRNYVHSTTLYGELIAGARAAGFEPDGPIELKVRRLMRGQPQFHYETRAQSALGNPPVTFSLSAGGALWHGAVIERTEPVRQREAYDETPIWNGACPEGRGVQFDGESGMQPIETVTALTLWLHRRLFTIPDDRKWFLSRLDLKRPLVATDARRLRIDVARNVGTAMTRSPITADDGVIGCIEFMLGDNTP
jgi:hypothetical protein